MLCSFLKYQPMNFEYLKKFFLHFVSVPLKRYDKYSAKIKSLNQMISSKLIDTWKTPISDF